MNARPVSRPALDLLFLCLVVSSVSSRGVAEDGSSRLSIERSVVAEGDEEWDFTQARTAFIESDKPWFLTTMSLTAKVGAHGYHDVYHCISKDDGKTWTRPEIVPPLRRGREEDGFETVAGDLWPMWHARTGKVLIAGKRFNFEGGVKENNQREAVAYAVIDPDSLESSPMRILELPSNDHENKPIVTPNSGCHQWIILEDGNVLLPIRYQRQEGERNYTSLVALCRFDGETLTYLAHGTEHNIPTHRGLYEPSVYRFGGRYFLTLRADDDAWVCRSDDGLNYGSHIPWTFDDGNPLGSYNTQQHWTDIGGKLYLIYTRRGANNDHIMRHRAPLFIAEVDPDKLHVIRSSEQILVPENNATLGNSGVCRIDDTESWITVAEGRVATGPRAGENNQVILARVSIGNER